MKRWMKKAALTISGCLLLVLADAQNVGINTSGAAPNASAMLDIDATNRGLLIPRVALTSTASNAPVGAGVTTSLMVYNTATIADVTPGYYYWNGSSWTRFSASGDDWYCATAATSTNPTTGLRFFGTSTNQHVDLVTNGTVRGRLSNIGEFFIGTTVTALPGDLMNGVGNATFPWAVNGYSNQNGSGVYGSVTGGATVFAAVQGEYVGTNIQGTGVRGSYFAAGNGTAFSTAGMKKGIQGTQSGGNLQYGCGIFGDYGNNLQIRCAGVFGWDGVARGALGYYTSGFASVAVYGFGGAYTVGAAGGYLPEQNRDFYASSGNENIKPIKSFIKKDDEVMFHTWSDQRPNATIGLGIYGGVMGGWIKGLVYGTNLSGAKYGVYVHGKTITNNLIVTLNDADETEKRIPTYAPSAMKVDVTERGKSKLVNGRATVKFTEEFAKLISSDEPVTVTVTPLGSSKGVYIESYTADGFVVVENEGGSSQVEFNWIAIGVKKGFENPQISPEIMARDFEEKMNGHQGVMYNDNNTENQKYSPWFDGKQVRFDNAPSKERLGVGNASKENLFRYAGEK